MKTSKILPVKYPVITCHPSTAGMLSILAAHPNTIEWVYSTFIQIIGYAGEDESHKKYLDLTIVPGYNGDRHCPYIHPSLISRDLVEQFSGGIINFLITTINEGYYAYLVVDQYYFKNGPHGRSKKHFPHDLFIYGYDLETQLFYVADFTFQASYSYETVPISELEEGYYVIKPTPDHDYLYNGRGGVAIWKFYDRCAYPLNVPLIRNQMIEYLQSDGIGDAYRGVPFDEGDSREYGIRLYDRVIEFFAYKEPPYLPHRRSLHNLYDHKVLMEKRLSYLEQKGFLNPTKRFPAQYGRIKEQFLDLTNMTVKSEIKKTPLSYEKIIQAIRSIKEEETGLLMDIIKALK